MPENTITQVNLNSKYRVKFEKAASANKIDGFVIESNDDNLETALRDARYLYTMATAEVELKKPVPPAPVIK
jgi:hypothetical protein